ncbi:MAG: proprotein convertase P-domain-containing protein, partial [Saprospiraceae bacterium]
MVYKKVQFLLFLTAVLLCCGLVQSIQAQCVTSGAQLIPDNGTLIIEFFVSGLTDSDLASPTQGICAVELDFMHEYLGDLTVSLVSPAGTVVQLIGPVTTAIGATNLTRWNISFLPCLTSVTPDAGFTDVWSNEQSWLAFTPYSGSYHPQTGCLENFSVGSANGLWRLIVQDNNLFEVGTITSASLIFCNPAGLQCVECNPVAGTLSPVTVSLCEGTAFNSSGIAVDYGGPAQPPSLYSYLYLLINGNSIINSGSSFSASPPVGSYSICGLSYLTADSMAIDMLVDAGDYNQLGQAINAGTICAQLTSSCIDFTVLAISDTVFINQDLCEGESFTFRGQVYNATGIYIQTADGPGNCDSIYILDIAISTFDVSTNIPGLLDCTLGSIILDAIVTGNMGSVQYQWSTNTGNIIGSTTTDQIVVNQPGHYIVKVNDSNCEAIAEIDVEADDNYPKILLEGGILTCNLDSVPLIPIYVPTNGTVSWSGPLGFSSDQPFIHAFTPGTYTFTVTNETNCSVSKMIEVGIDTMTYSLNVILAGKNCSLQNAYFQLSNPQNIAALNWTGPNNLNSNSFQVTITDPGIYTVEALYNNGCSNTNSFAFDGDFDLPEITVSPNDTLNCNEVILLNVSSITNGVSYGWSGPGGISSGQPQLPVTQNGDYLASVYASNGCVSQEIVNIINGNDIFSYQFFSDTLDCKTDTVLVGVVAPEADLFHWINYPFADSTQSTISVTSPGQYVVMMTDTNSGCVIEARILIEAYYPYPSFGYTIDTVTCTNLLAEINFVPLAGFIYTDIYYLLPDASIVQGPTLFSNLPGEHQLIGMDPAGCIGIWRIHIPFDTLPPVFYPEADTLGCDLNGQIETV